MRKHRIMPLLLAVSLGVSLLAGCGGSGGEGNGGGQAAAGAGENGAGGGGNAGGSRAGGENAGENGGRSAGNAGAAGGAGGAGSAGNQNGGQNTDIPLGRFVEEEIEIPSVISQMRFLTMLRGKDGRLELYMGSSSGEENARECRRLYYNGTEWQEDYEWNRRIREQIASGAVCGVPDTLAYGLDGNCYFTAADDDYVFHLYRVQENGDASELFPEVFLPRTGDTYGLIPSQIDVTADGRILLHDFDYIYCYREDGAKLFTMEKFSSASSGRSVGYIEENEFVTITDDGVTRYSLDDGHAVETIPYDESVSESKEDNTLFGDGGGGIYLANRQGLFHVGRGGSLWEQVIDGKLNSMGRESMYMIRFLPGNAGDFYGCFSSGGGSRISVCHYTYDPDMLSVPLSTLTIYSLRDNRTIRQAASVFQSGHPDVLVDVRTAAQTQSGDISEETIRALNTEIISGKGADVLILDGLPVDSYVEKGVLMDLRDVFAQIQAASPLLEQVVGSFTGADGSVYQMPVRFKVPVVSGGQDAVDAWKSLEGIRDYQGDQMLNYTCIYENLLRQVLSLYYKEIFGADGAGFDRSRMLVCLEAVRAMGQANGAKASFAEEELEQLHITNYVMTYGFTDGLYYDAGRAASGVDVVGAIMDFGNQQAYMANHPDTVVDTVGGVYFPAGLVGVNQATANPELAKEFVRCVFSLEVQRENLGDGFPVNQAGLDEQFAAEASSYSFGIGIPEWDYMQSTVYPDETNKARLRALLGTISQPVVLDETLVGMIVSGAMDYCEGKISVEQAASAIEQQIMLYQAEKG